MSAWVIFLVLVFLGMATYPILQIIPSKQQKATVELRQKAIKAGIRVKIRIPDVPDNQRIAFQRSALYSLPDETDINGTFTAIKSSNTQEWYWPGTAHPSGKYMARLLPLYEQLPAFCIGVEHSRAGSGIYVLENEIGEELDKIPGILAALNNAIKN